MHVSPHRFGPRFRLPPGLPAGARVAILAAFTVLVAWQVLPGKQTASVPKAAAVRDGTKPKAAAAPSAQFAHPSDSESVYINQVHAHFVAFGTSKNLLDTSGPRPKPIRIVGYFLPKGETDWTKAVKGRPIRLASRHDPKGFWAVQFRFKPAAGVSDPVPPQGASQVKVCLASDGPTTNNLCTIRSFTISYSRPMVARPGAKKVVAARIGEKKKLDSPSLEIQYPFPTSGAMTICTSFYAYGTATDGADTVTACYFDSSTGWTSTASVSDTLWFAEFNVTEGTNRQIDALDSMAGDVPPCGGAINNSNAACP
jgi:hypothetical protein